MTRSTVFVDRLSTFILGILFLAVGAFGVIWWLGQPLQLPEQVSLGGTESIVSAAWFPWAAAGLGVVLALVGVLWLGAHLKSRRVGQLRLQGSGRHGRLEVDAGKVADAAAAVLATTIGVRSARGYVEKDRGKTVAHLVATLEPEVDLELIARRADEVSAQLQQVLQRTDLACNVELKVATRGRPFTRAR